MNKTEKKKFVKDLAGSVVAEIVILIQEGRIPENWNGFELRQLLADKFAWNAIKISKDRLKEYQNAVLVNNL